MRTHPSSTPTLTPQDLEDDLSIDHNIATLFGLTHPLPLFTQSVWPPSLPPATISTLTTLFYRCAESPTKQKLVLSQLNLSFNMIPVQLIIEHFGDTLHKLSLKNNPIKSLPPDLFTNALTNTPVLLSLQNLDLSLCQLHAIPPFSLPNLRRLDLSSNHLRTIPDTLFVNEHGGDNEPGGLPKLTHLVLYYNNLDSELCDFTNAPQTLTNIDLSSNNLTTLPPGLTLLPLIRLTLSNNFLKILPPALIAIQSLTKLDVANNPICEPPMDACERGIEPMRRYYKYMRAKHSTTKAGAVLGITALQDGSAPCLSPTGPPTLSKKASRNAKKQLRVKTSTSRGSRAPEAVGRAASEGHSADGASPLSSTPPMLKTASSSPNFPPGSAPLVARALPSPLGSEECMRRAPHEEAVAPDPVRASASENPNNAPTNPPTTNNTLKVIFVGDESAGKTSLISRLRYGSTYYPGVVKSQNEDETYVVKFEDKTKSSNIPASYIILPSSSPSPPVQQDKTSLPPNTKVLARRDLVPLAHERTIGVDICKWSPPTPPSTPPVEFSMWDFAGQTAYHATHELYYSQRALYVLCWDMGAESTEFYLPDDIADSAVATSADESSDDDEFGFDFSSPAVKADPTYSLEKLREDVDKRVQFWIDCIQTSAPGAVILPIATYDDQFDARNDNGAEAERRCSVMKERILQTERVRVQDLTRQKDELTKEGLTNSTKFQYITTLLRQRPSLAVWPNHPIIRVSSRRSKLTGNYHGRDGNNGLTDLTNRLLHLATATNPETKSKLCLQMHTPIPDHWVSVKLLIKDLRKQNPFIRFDRFEQEAVKRSIPTACIVDALNLFSNVGEILFFDSSVSNSSSSSQSPDSLDDSESDSEASVFSDRNSSASHPPSSPSDPRFIFLNPKWLMLACKAIMRHDLKETLKLLDLPPSRRGLYMNNLCPVISKDEVLELWKNEKAHKQGNREAQFSDFYMATQACLSRLASSTPTSPSTDFFSPFQFLTKLLISFNVFVPVDLNIRETILGGVRVTDIDDRVDPFQFFLPSLIDNDPPQREIFIHKCDPSRTYQITLSQSFVIKDFQPMGMMHRIIANILRDVNDKPTYVHNGNKMELRLVAVDCYSTQKKVTFNTVYRDTGEVFATVETFVGLYDYRDQHIGGVLTPDGCHRLVVSAKGARGSDAGSKVWSGGYNLVLKAVGRTVKGYTGMTYKSEVFCPYCIQLVQLTQCHSFEKRELRGKLIDNKVESVICPECTLDVDIRLLLNRARYVIHDNVRRMNREEELKSSASATEVWGSGEGGKVDVAVVTVMVMSGWDEDGVIKSMGSGFVVDAAKGLIVSAAHVVFDRRSRMCLVGGGGAIVIGVINHERKAVWKYVAHVVKEQVGGKGEEFFDVCVLKIGERLTGNGGGGNGGGGFGSFEDMKSLGLTTTVAEGELVGELAEMKLWGGGDVDIFSPVWLLGFPQVGGAEEVNVFLTSFVGSVRAMSEGVLQLNVENHSGNSGGPVLLRNKNTVVGVLSKGENDDMTAWAVPVDRWRWMVDEARDGRSAWEKIMGTH